MKLHTIGYEGIQVYANKVGEELKYSTSRQSSDSMLNTGSGFAFTNSKYSTRLQNSRYTKSNYSRRWRGIEGEATTPFAPAFGLGYEKNYLDSPFVSATLTLIMTTAQVFYQEQEHLMVL